MAKSYSQFLSESTEKSVYFVFGRFNPPTIGHQKLLEKLKKVAGNNPSFVYASQKQDKKNNPLPYELKLYWMKRLFPKANIMADNSVISPFDVFQRFSNDKIDNVYMVVGSDRIDEFKRVTAPYVESWGFKKLEFISAGNRDPDSEGVEGVSATKMRQAVKDDDFKTFSLGCPNATKNKFDCQELFDDMKRSI